jgi:hypothetical protein
VRPTTWSRVFVPTVLHVKSGNPLCSADDCQASADARAATTAAASCEARSAVAGQGSGWQGDCDQAQRPCRIASRAMTVRKALTCGYRIAAVRYIRYHDSQPSGVYPAQNLGSG